MQVVHPIKIAVNGEWATTDSLSLTVGEILGMFGLEGFRLKNMRSGTEYFNFDQSIFLSWGDEFLTPNDGHHGYDVAKFRRQQQAPDAESKL